MTTKSPTKVTFENPELTEKWVQDNLKVTEEMAKALIRLVRAERTCRVPGVAPEAFAERSAARGALKKVGGSEWMLLKQQMESLFLR